MHFHAAGAQMLYRPVQAHWLAGGIQRQRAKGLVLDFIDLTVQDFMTARNIPIYIAQPSLVQHWGKRSAAGSFYQQSPTFRGDAEEAHR